MSATILLVRHGHTAATGRRLSGRLPGIELTLEGRAQAERLVGRLHNQAVAAIYSSPVQRALETARPLARARGLEIVECPGLDEIDFGHWTGLTFDELESQPGWRAFNTARGSVVIPGGESPVDVQRRAVAAVEAIASRHPGATPAAFTHGDIIRSVLIHYAGKPLDHIEHYQIRPASITALSITGRSGRILYIGD